MAKTLIDKTGNESYSALALSRWRMMDIHKLLNEKRKELEQLQREVDALSIAAGLLSKEQPQLSIKYGQQSQPQLVIGILEAAGKPLHVRQIVEQLHEKFHKKVKKTNLGVLLYRYAQRGKHFYKVAGKPNTYGLLKWRSLMASHNRDFRAVQ